MSVILLRVRGGLDFSSHIVDEELVEPEVMMMVITVKVKVIMKSSLPSSLNPQNLFPEDNILRRPEGLDRKISVEQGGKKKISVDRAQVIIGKIIRII